MRHARAIGNSRGSSEPLSSDLESNNTFAIPAMGFTNTDSIDASPVGVALAAGLTSSCGGERGPANAGQPGEGSLPGGPGSPQLAFDVAAVLRGHNISTVEGRENARHDYRVWDLAEAMRP